MMEMQIQAEWISDQSSAMTERAFGEAKISLLGEHDRHPVGPLRRSGTHLGTLRVPRDADVICTRLACPRFLSTRPEPLLSRSVSSTWYLSRNASPSEPAAFVQSRCPISPKIRLALFACPESLCTRSVPVEPRCSPLLTRPGVVRCLPSQARVHHYNCHAEPFVESDRSDGCKGAGRLAGVTLAKPRLAFPVQEPGSAALLLQSWRPAERPPIMCAPLPTRCSRPPSFALPLEPSHTENLVQKSGEFGSTRQL